MGLVEIATSLVFISIGTIIISLSIFTIYVLYKHYMETHIFDYLILLIFYAAAILNTLIGLIYRDRDPDTNNILSWHGRALLYFSAIITWYFLYFHGVRLLWDSPPPRLHNTVLAIFGINIAIGLFKIYDLDSYQNTLLGFDTYMGNLLRVITGFIPFYAYVKFQPIDHSKSIRRSRIAYGFMGLIQFLIGAINLVITIILDVTSYSNEELESLVVTQSLVLILAIFAFLASFIVSISYPESILISQAQISRINEYYSLVKNKNLQLKEHHWKYDQLIAYIANLPPELFEKSNI